MQKITVKEVEYTAFVLAQEIMSFDEPIPDFKTRFSNILESCIAAPFQAFQEKSFYPGLIDKAAILFSLVQGQGAGATQIVVASTGVVVLRASKSTVAPSIGAPALVNRKLLRSWLVKLRPHSNIA